MPPPLIIHHIPTFIMDRPRKPQFYQSSRPVLASFMSSSGYIKLPPPPRFEGLPDGAHAEPANRLVPRAGPRPPPSTRPPQNRSPEVVLPPPTAPRSGWDLFDGNGRYEAPAAPDHFADAPASSFSGGGGALGLAVTGLFPELANPQRSPNAGPSSSRRKAPPARKGPAVSCALGTAASPVPAAASWGVPVNGSARPPSEPCAACVASSSSSSAATIVAPNPAKRTRHRVPPAKQPPKRCDSQTLGSGPPSIIPKR